MRAGRAFRKLLKKYKDEEVTAVDPKLPKIDISANEETKVQISVLSTEEIVSAEKFCLRQIQMTAFKDEYKALSKGENISFKSSIRSLNPVWDQREGSSE